MAYIRMTVTLPENEFELLRAMSEADMRFPKAQIRYLIVQEAERRQRELAATASDLAEVYNGEA